MLSVTNSLGHVITTAYDALYRKTQETDGAGHTIAFGWDANSNNTSITDGLGKVTTISVDELNRPYKTTDPLGHFTLTTRDGEDNVVQSQDGNGNLSWNIVDPANRPIASRDARGGLVRSTLDAESNTIGILDPVGNQTTFMVDALSQVTQERDPNGKVTTTTRDSAGRVTSIVDRLGRRREFTYDNDDRPVQEVWKDANGNVVNTRTWSYDADGNVLTAGDNSGSYTFTYDELNQVATSLDIWGITVTNTRDSEGHIIVATDSKGGTLSSTYNNSELLVSRSLSASGLSPIRIDIGYNNRDDLTGISRYTDLAGTQLVGTTANTVDDAGRLTNITNKNAAGTTLSYYAYAFDNGDHVNTENWVSGANNGSRNFSYDVTNQLTGDGTNSWSFDLNGNRTLLGYQTGVSNRLLSDGTWNYGYDDEGNMISKSRIGGNETWTFGYDHLNHLVSVSQVINGVTQLTINYTYDIFGQRIQESKWKIGIGTVTTRFGYANGVLFADLDVTNNVTVRYVYGDAMDQLLVRDIVGGANAGVAFYLTDRLGSVRDLQDSFQVIRDHLDYDGFGNITIETSPSFGDRLKFTRREYDSDTGLYYVRARYLRPSTGTWTSEDPERFQAGDPNLCRFVSNNSTNYVDPDGLRPVHPLANLPQPPLHRPTIWGKLIVIMKEVDELTKALERGWFGAAIYGSDAKTTGEAFKEVRGTIGKFPAHVASMGSEIAISIVASSAAAKVLKAGGYFLKKAKDGSVALFRRINGSIRAATKSETQKVLKQIRKLAPRPPAITPPKNRGGLRAGMGQPPARLPNPQAQHDLPWTFRDWFAAEGRGLNVNDAAFGRWVSGTPPGGHQRWTAAFEAEWRAFIRGNNQASRQEVLDFMNRLRADPRFR